MVSDASDLPNLLCSDSDASLRTDVSTDGRAALRADRDDGVSLRVDRTDGGASLRAEALGEASTSSSACTSLKGVEQVNAPPCDDASGAADILSRVDSCWPVSK